MEVKIRRIENTDYTDILELIKEFSHFEGSPDKMINSVTQMHHETDLINGFVAVSKDLGILGYTTCFFSYHTWVGKSLYMDDLYVKDGYRNQGIGKRLINAVIEFAKAEECNRIRWQVSDWNENAQEFYRNLGAKLSKTEYNCDLVLV